jgi:hypothetical protein
MCVKPAVFGLLCAWREVLILRQQVALFPHFKFSSRIDVGTDRFRQQRVAVHAARSDPSMPGARAAGHAAQWRERERVARTKERRLRRQKCREQYSDEYQLREQQGVSPPGTPAESSSEEEEESDGGGPLLRGGIPRPRRHGPRRRLWS